VTLRSWETAEVLTEAEASISSDSSAMIAALLKGERVIGRIMREVRVLSH
jgi:hypothetical protein